MGNNEKLTTSKQQEDWVNEQLDLFNTNSGRRWSKKGDGFKTGALVRMEAKLSGMIKGGQKQIVIKKKDLDLIEQQAVRSLQIPILIGGFKDDDFEDQFVIIRWSYFFKLFNLARKGRESEKTKD